MYMIPYLIIYISDFWNCRHLSVENISIESRLQKCESDYEQRLSIANDQVESLQKELHR